MIAFCDCFFVTHFLWSYYFLRINFRESIFWNQFPVFGENSLSCRAERRGGLLFTQTWKSKLIRSKNFKGICILKWRLIPSILVLKIFLRRKPWWSTSNVSRGVQPIPVCWSTRAHRVGVRKTSVESFSWWVDHFWSCDSLRNEVMCFWTVLRED